MMIEKKIKPLEMGSYLDSEGNLPRSVNPDYWLVPGFIDLELSDTSSVETDRLVWAYLGEEGEIFRKTASQGLLAEFLELAESTPKKILSYARRWGVLYVCKHDRISGHKRTEDENGPGPKTGYFSRCELRQTRNNAYWEPLFIWREYAQKARAIINLAAKLHDGKKGRPDDWEVLYGPNKVLQVKDSKPLTVTETVFNERVILSLYVKGWLDDGHVQPHFQWGKKDPQITLMTDTLFGALALRLLMLISRTGGIALCSACGTPYFPKRRPQSRRRRYCNKCGKKVAQKDASKAYRDREREKSKTGSF